MILRHCVIALLAPRHTGSARTGCETPCWSRNVTSLFAGREYSLLKIAKRLTGLNSRKLRRKMITLLNSFRSSLKLLFANVQISQLARAF